MVGLLLVLVTWTAVIVLLARKLRWRCAGPWLAPAMIGVSAIYFLGVFLAFDYFAQALA